MKFLLLIAVVVVLLAGGGAWWFANDRARTIVDDRLDEMVASGSYERAQYETLRVGINGDIAMTNLNLVQGPLDVTLRDITITNLDYANEFPRHMDVSVNGLQVALGDAATDAEGLALSTMLQQFGTTEEIPLELDYSYTYAPDNAYQMDSTMRLAVAEFFTLDASSVTRNIQMETLDQLNDADPLVAQQQLAALMQAAEFPSMTMTLRDQGFLEDVLATTAQQNGVSPEDFRTLLVSQIQNFYLFLPANAQAFAMAAGAEMAEFLEGGKTITISVAPEYGGNLQRLQQEVMGAALTGDYGKVSELLHLEIETTAAP
jgi:hypothetical protein